MKPLRMIMAVCAACMAVLLVIGLAVGSAVSSPVDSAKASAVGNGWRPEQMGLRDFQMASGLFGGTARVEFNAKGPRGPKVVRVDLMRPPYSPDWRVTGYDEGGAKKR
jgi:hypothetical protein